jgi:STAM-binding protein
MPPPMTTTSPAPHAFPIRYPSLMSLHQRTQGYKPSLESMFKPEAEDNDTPQGNEPSMLFGTTPQSYGSTQSYRTIGDRVIPSPPEDIRAPGWPGPGPSSYSPQGPMQSYPQGVYPHGQAGPSRIETSARDPVTHHLKTVSLPRECLPRFLSIAAVNTAANRETCGLLLGKDRGTKYAVTTLLVPKQRATSDTCAMEEEELVLQFTEERNLITLGWIHTHPTQSCFMSSLDLHTHAGFQRMLPESFAVVCSPKHEPPFGIFRLTDPPGLDIILDCTAKEAFHPHIAAPIYTVRGLGFIRFLITVSDDTAHRTRTRDTSS